MQLDLLNYNVPAGFQALLDGTIVADQYADALKAEEMRTLGEDETFARTIADTSNSLTSVRLVKAMLASDSIAAKRVLRGLMPMYS